MPRIGATSPDPADRIRDAGGEPVLLDPPRVPPEYGVTLAREWTADVVAAAAENLDALFLDAERPEELFGLLLAALRLNLPAVAHRRETALSVALVALGIAPLEEDSAGVVVDVARSNGPGPTQLSGTFALANALRAGLSVGAGPELLVHLSALAREARATGFPRMLKVLVPESPVLAAPDSPWFREHGPAGLLAHLGDALHSVPTVTGRLKSHLPEPPPEPEKEGPGMSFVRGRASGTEAVCKSSGVPEISGECRVFHSEEDAVRAASSEDLSSSLILVGGYGPRGGPGLRRLDRLGEALEEAGIQDDVAVLTDGIAPEGSGPRISLFSPEAVVGGVIGRLRDGDVLKIDLEAGRIRTRVSARELEERESFSGKVISGYGYAARYARSALAGLEGAGFS
ncbi:MAG: dihydroxy-acid dehydratase [Rubrobacteraceae bacterium]